MHTDAQTEHRSASALAPPVGDAPLDARTGAAGNRCPARSSRPESVYSARSSLADEATALSGAPGSTALEGRDDRVQRRTGLEDYSAAGREEGDDEVKVTTTAGSDAGTDSTAPPATQRAPPTGFKLFLLLIALLLIEVLVGLDNTIVATSTATIANDFRALSDVGWYGSAYLLTAVSCQPLAGRAFAFFPQKWCLLFGLVAFEVGCVVAAVAQNSPVFILGRAIQGFG